MIELKSFSKKYPSQKECAVSDFSMNCTEGEITGLLGLNGAGKTTILKAICARHFASVGEVFICGTNAKEQPGLVRNLTGFVQEEPNLPSEYTVAEYLNMVASLHGITTIALEPDNDSNRTSLLKKTMDFRRKSESAWQSIKNLSLEELLPKKIKTLSKGQKQRVNFAQSLIYNPKVLVFDEPASGLDPAQILKMRSLVKSLKKEHTILLSTHLMQEVEALCDKIYIIHEGKLAANGTKEEITAQCQAKNLEEAFFKITKTKDFAK